LRLTGENIVIDHRHRGPVTSGNGGWSAGLLAAHVQSWCNSGMI
jgi:hypothetical protein